MKKNLKFPKVKEHLQLVDLNQNFTMIFRANLINLNFKFDISEILYF